MKSYKYLTQLSVVAVLLTLDAGGVLAANVPLTLHELDQLARHANCVEDCGVIPNCTDLCVEAEDGWDKDLTGEALRTRKDYDLSVLEYWDDNREIHLCYSPDECDGDCRVIPKGLCDAQTCLDGLQVGESEEKCMDFDGDGFSDEQEIDMGTSDRAYNDTCVANDPQNTPCTFAQKCAAHPLDQICAEIPIPAKFVEVCVQHDICDPTNPASEELENKDLCDSKPLGVGLGMCVERPCASDGSCTAFHLERIAVNNNELIVRVHYDYAPVPANVLELHIQYDDNTLHLIDTRALKGITKAQVDVINPETGETVTVNTSFELAANHPAKGLLRLVVYGLDNLPIPQGKPVVELVFDRLSGSQSSVGFISDDYLQRMSMAPEQGPDGSVSELLEDDALWGDNVQVPAADPNGPRLLLHYGFDNHAKLLNYKDVMSGVELCQQVAECVTLDDGLPQEREAKEKLIARLEALQRGRTNVSELQDGVIGQAAYMDGRTDRLEMPLTINTPQPNGDGILFYDRVDQSFSLSTWFYSEGDESLSIQDEGQILFSRNTVSETTRFGLSVQDGIEGGDVALVWFQDDIMGGSWPVTSTSPNRRVVHISDLDAKTWYHIGMVLTDTLEGYDDDGDGLVDSADEDELDHVTFYVNGVPVPLDDIDPIDGVAESNTWLPFVIHNETRFQGDGYGIECPSPQDQGGLLVHEEGELMLNGGSPDVLFYASAENNLFGIEQIDTRGLANEELIRDGVSAAKDPDYSPLLDKLVYSSSKSDNYEIWVSNGDGSGARQITTGFGDTARKIFARRPKWAPDGSAIVFESNIYSLEYNDNAYRRTYHLYYIAFDAKIGEVAIPVEGGGTVTELDYDFVSSNQIVEDYRLTDGSNHHYGVVWKTGKPIDDSNRGQIWFNKADDDYEVKEIYSLEIPKHPAPSGGELVVFNDCEEEAPESSPNWFGDPIVPDGSIPKMTMLAAHYSHPAGYVPQSAMLYNLEWSEYVDADDFTIAASSPIWDSEEGREKVEVEIYSPVCNLSIPGDCPVEIPGVFVEYDFAAYVADAGDSTKMDLGTKEVQIGDNFTAGAQSLKVRVRSEINTDPIGPGTHLATLLFWLKDTVTANPLPFIAKKRNVRQQLRIADMTRATPRAARFLIDGNGETNANNDIVNTTLEFVTGAAFSPDGRRIALTGIQNARPVVLVSKADDDNYLSDIDIPSGINGYQLNIETPFVHTCQVGKIEFEKVSEEPMNVDGMDWSKVERLYPCNWVGIHQNKHSKIYSHAFRGGLDELKLYSYPREPKAFESDFERGEAWLDKEDQLGPMPDHPADCTSSFECPAYKVCDKSQSPGECVIQECNPIDDLSCGGEGVCTLMPIPAQQGENMPDHPTEVGEIWAWVCSVECASDTQCFSEECLNGPCRFCDDNTKSCIECRETEKDMGGFTVPYLEGCPDQNSFYCEAGSCLTECYSFENGESLFLCDSALEYCHQGRCKIFEWSWYDIAPASFSGLGESSFDFEDYQPTVALTQIYPIEIAAYGVEDYLQPPVLLVEGKADLDDGAFGKDWFKIGQIRVHNKTSSEADQNKYVVHTPLPISHVRVRQIIPQYDNLSLGATGYDNGDDEEFCRDFERITCNRWAEPPNSDVCMDWRHAGACKHRAPGSRAGIGYPVGITRLASRKACYERGGGAECKYQANDEALRYLHGGQPTVVINTIKVAGKQMTDTHMADSKGYNKICGYLQTDGSVGTKPNYSSEDYNFNEAAPLVFGDITSELSNQKAMLYPGATEASKVIDISITPTAEDLGGSWFLLNCTLFGETTDDQTGLKFTVCSSDTECDILYPTTGRIGSILETGNGNCAIEDGMHTTPCYEWHAADVSMDCMSYMDGAKEPWRTLDFDVFRSFGYDEY